jgi:ketosteroid isomerase-like protein
VEAVGVEISRENVEIVRRVYESVARRDADSVLELYDPDVEWDGSRGTPFGALRANVIYHGHDGLRAAFRHWYEARESIEARCEELTDAGDQVVSVSSFRVKGRARSGPRVLGLGGRVDAARGQDRARGLVCDARRGARGRGALAADASRAS